MIRRLYHAIGILLLASGLGASGDQLTWDSDANKQNGATDGSAIWDQNQNNKVWFTGTADQKWNNAQLDDAIFGAGGVAGIVTLGENIIARTLTFNATASGTYALAGPFTLTLSTGVSAGPGNITNYQSATIGTVISGLNQLTKWGGDTLTLTAANTYSGNTTINQGSLRLNNVTGSGTGTGNVIINAGGMLMGSGSLSGSVTLNRSAAISAGNSVGTLTTGGQNWNPGGYDIFEINDVDAGAGLGWDFLNINGPLAINATLTDKFTLDVRSLTLANTPGSVHDFDNNLSYAWTLASATSGISFASGQNESTVFNLILGQFSNGLGGGNFSVGVANGNKDLVLQFTPAPEPGTCLLLGLGAAAFFWRIRRPPPSRPGTSVTRSS